VAAVEELRNESLTRHQSPLLVIECGDDVGITVAGIERFKLDHPSGRIAVLAGSPSIENLILFFDAGANVLLVKTASRETFVRTLWLAALGETLLPREFLGHLRSGAPKQQLRTAGPDHEIGSSHLSDRERSILHCLIQGASNKVIARRIGIAESTVKVHVKTILRKIRVHNRTQAAIWAMNNNLFTAAPEAGLLSDSGVPLLDNSGTGRVADRGDAGDAPILLADLHGPPTANGAGRANGGSRVVLTNSGP
jgi:two-component system nitrate/nitrite response regulator NarL